LGAFSRSCLSLPTSVTRERETDRPKRAKDADKPAQPGTTQTGHRHPHEPDRTAGGPSRPDGRDGGTGHGGIFHRFGLRVVSETLGHASIRITKDPDSHPSGAQRKHAADAMDAALWRAVGEK